MNLRKASKRDRQLEAWTKVPTDVGSALRAWAKEQKISEYEAVRRLIYTGMLAATAAHEHRLKRFGTGIMTAKTYKRFLKCCEREMRWHELGIKPEGPAAKALEEAEEEEAEEVEA